MNAEQKQALIEHAKSWIADSEAMRDEIPFGFDDDTEKELSLIKIALAALTAPPDDWKQRAEAADAKLAELAKQEPRYFYREHNSYNGMKTDWTEVSAEQLDHLKEIIDPETAEIIELFARPAPAADLAELVPNPSDNKYWGNDGYGTRFKVQTYHGDVLAILRNIEEVKK